MLAVIGGSARGENSAIRGRGGANRLCREGLGQLCCPLISGRTRRESQRAPWVPPHVGPLARERPYPAAQPPAAGARGERRHLQRDRRAAGAERGGGRRRLP